MFSCELKKCHQTLGPVTQLNRLSEKDITGEGHVAGQEVIKLYRIPPSLNDVIHTQTKQKNKKELVTHANNNDTPCNNIQITY